MLSFFASFTPTDTPSRFWTEYIETLSDQSEIIEQLFPDDGVLARKAQKRLNSADTLKPRAAFGLMLSIDKLFAEKSEVFPSFVEGTRGEILTGLIKAVIKVLTLADCVEYG